MNFKSNPRLSLYFKKIIWIIGLILVILGFFYPIFKGKLPIPADTLLGMYHPWRDKVWQDRQPFPVKNFLITDPVRQTYVYKKQAIDQLKKGQLPLWNPNIFSGIPLLASVQAGVFYPINLLFCFDDFKLSWSMFILIQPILGAIFMYLYLKNLKIGSLGSSLISLSWAFSGFMMTWMTWGNIGHTALWLPLILLTIDKIFDSKNFKKTDFKWFLILIFGLCSSFTAGHSQTWLYLGIFSVLYFVFRLFDKKISSKKFFLFLLSAILVLLLTSIQWLPTFRLVSLSGRNQDLPKAQPGWFLPGFHLVQLIAPDFFGNPVTQNYWGVWNYGELTSYVGIFGLFMAIYGLIFCRHKLKKFFITGLFLSLILATPNFISRLFLNLPIIGSFQPTRLIFVFDFCFLVLAGFGWQDWLKQKSFKKTFLSLFILASSFGLVFLFSQNAFWLPKKFDLDPNLQVSQRNLIFPALLFISLSGLLLVKIKFKKLPAWLFGLILIGLVSFDLGRFFHKFTPFIDQYLVYPQTKTTRFLQEQTQNYPWRVTGIDIIPGQKRIMLPNFNLIYNLAMPDGYDPLYLKNYAELISLLNWGNFNNKSFNRTLLIENYDSPLFDLLGIKYVLALRQLPEEKFELIFSEGETQVYENKNVLPRAFLVTDYLVAKSSDEQAKTLLNKDLRKIVILEKDINLEFEPLKSSSLEMVKYSANQIELKTQTDKPAILVLTDSFYPGWKAEIDSNKTEILKANHAFRAIVIPAGRHNIVFKTKLL